MADVIQIHNHDKRFLMLCCFVFLRRHVCTTDSMFVKLVRTSSVMPVVPSTCRSSRARALSISLFDGIGIITLSVSS
ncbi:hypothetical protein LSH36_60g03030, partial [Paralvinella palmiformis]